MSAQCIYVQRIGCLLHCHGHSSLFAISGPQGHPGNIEGMWHEHHYLNQHHDAKLLITIIGVRVCAQQNLEKQIQRESEDGCGSSQIAEEGVNVS